MVSFNKNVYSVKVDNKMYYGLKQISGISFEPDSETTYNNAMMVTTSSRRSGCGTATALVLKSSELDRLFASLTNVDNEQTPRMTVNLEGFKSTDLEKIKNVSGSKHIMSISFDIQITVHTDAGINLEDENIMLRQYTIYFNKSSLVEYQEI